MAPATKPGTDRTRAAAATRAQGVRSAWPAVTGLLLLLVSSLAGAPTAVAGDDYPAGSRIEWKDFDPTLFARSRAENRPLFLYFHGQWCTWCRDFQEESLEHDDVVDVIRRGYIPVLIDLDRRRDLFTRYGGRGLPFVVIVDARNAVRGRFTGHVGPEDLARVLAERRRQISVTGRELSPSDEPIASADAFLEMLDQVYDPRTRRLSGSAMFGTLSKRPQPWTLAFLLRQDAWSERMPELLDQATQDLWDPEEGGFFFFYDPDQPDRARALETSKRLDQNAAFLWLFADAYRRFGNEAYRQVVERNLDYLRIHLWDPEQQRFYSSQYSDGFYYAQPMAVRRNLSPPPVDRTTYADASGQAIAALVRAAEALDDPTLLEWAGTALEGLERHLRSGNEYLHALPPDGPPELAGYLPAQVWPGIAWNLHATAADARDGDIEQTLLEAVSSYLDPDLDAYRERRTDAFEPWVETRTQAALTWWLARLPADAIERADVDPKRVHAQVIIPPGTDPDDAALGFWALDRQ
ncbi:DUF255 domain-containing protein [Thioalkalivibrio sp.]|uniref:DUF255 domain-containing protein n=1 Tax=Thioalkalivibrio sp. TaxID=2093813 RepID=UPI003974C0C2